MKREMSAPEVAEALALTIEMLNELEDFVGVNLSKPREIAALVLGAYHGNEVDAQAINALYAAHNHNTQKQEHSHGNVIRHLRIVPNPEDPTPPCQPSPNEETTGRDG